MIDLSQVVRRQRLPIELVFEIAANMIVGRHNVTGRERAHCTVVKAEHLIPLGRLHWRSPRALTGTTVERVPPIAASTAWAVRPIELVVMLLPVQSRSLSGWLLRGNIRAVTADVLAAPSDGDALKLRYTTDLRSGDYAAVDRSTALIALQVIVDRHPALLRCFTIAKAKIPIPIRRHTIVLASNESSDLYALR